MSRTNQAIFANPDKPIIDVIRQAIADDTTAGEGVTVRQQPATTLTLEPYPKYTDSAFLYCMKVLSRISDKYRLSNWGGQWTITIDTTDRQGNHTGITVTSNQMIQAVCDAVSIYENNGGDLC